MTQKLLSVSTQCGMIASSATFEFSLSGLECLLFGPCAFELDLASMQLKSRFNSWIWNDRVLPESQCTHRDGIRWIERYIQYLQHLQSMIVV